MQVYSQLPWLISPRRRASLTLCASSLVWLACSAGDPASAVDTTSAADAHAGSDGLDVAPSDTAMGDTALDTSADNDLGADTVGGDTAGGDTVVAGPESCRAAVSDGALRLDCGGVEGVLSPFVIVDGERVSGVCEPVGDALRCDIGAGELWLRDPSGWVLEFNATQSVTVGGLGFNGSLAVAGARAWLSNGFQSWSMSGALALRGAPSDEARQTALAARGDPETLRGGEELSWWWTAVGGGASTLVAGVTTANTWKSWITVDGTDPQALVVSLVSGGATVSAGPGDTVRGEAWFVGAAADGVALLAEYGASVPTRRTAPLLGEAGWNSWYDLWDGVDAEAVLQNAELARVTFDAGGLPSSAPLRVVVDDGWQQGWGRWLPNDKFPGGLEALATTLHAQGLEVGVWLAPLLVDGEDPVVAEHPDWFVGDLTYPHALHGAMRVLDVTHPAAAAYLRDAIQRLTGWGLDFLKIDFLFAGTWEGPRHVPMTGMAAYRAALALIRDAAGPNVTLLAVGAPPVAGFDLLDAWRLGPDIALEAFGPSWAFIAPQARNLAVRWPLCAAVACDADPPILRQLPLNEVQVGAWVAALAGGAYFLSDDLRELPEERRAWGFSPPLLQAGLAGVASRPEAVFPAEAPERLSNAFEDALGGASTSRLPTVWRTPSGQRVALNFGEEPLNVEGTAVPGRSVALLP